MYVTITNMYNIVTVEGPTFISLGREGGGGSAPLHSSLIGPVAALALSATIRKHGVEAYIQTAERVVDVEKHTILNQPEEE